MRIEIPVDGMRCESCERAVGKALERLDGVTAADADHEAKRVRVSFDPDRVGEPRLREQIAEAGFDPR